MDEKIIGLDKNKDIDRRLGETTKELQREREKLMAVIRMSGDLIFEYDIAKDQMHYAGPEEGSLYCGQITEGYTEQLLREVDNRTDAVEQQLAEALHSGKPDICIELCKTDEEGNPHWMKVIGQTFYNEKKEPERVLGKVCDIDAQKKKERELQEKSQRDSLTGLLNHSTIKQQITHRLQKMKRGQVGYLIVLDVDSFKKINDTNGHLFGDAVLCSFADEMNKLFPEALKGRIGGDEFVCYVENMPREELEEKLGQLNHCMSDRYDDDKTGLHISCSLGAAVTDGTVTDYNLLFRWADAALYQVKSREKGAYDLLEVKEGVALPGQSYLDSEENKEDEIVHKEAQFESAEDLVLFCMDLLENVPNLTSALKVISERTCSFFNIDDMICVEVNEAGPSIRYQWNREEKKNFVKRILHPGVFEWDRIRKRADESGAAIYRQSETPNIYKEEAESVMIVMSTASKGLTPEDYLNATHPDDVVFVRKYMEHMFRGIDKDFNVKYRSKTKWDDEWQTLLVTGIQVERDKEGHVTRYTGITINNTKWEKMIQQLKELKEKAELSDRLKSAFLANMSHEIRTPLNAIVGFSELMVTCDDPEEKKEYINIIQSNNELLLRLINDILDLSKIESGIIERRKENFNLAKVCNELFVTIQAKMTNPNVELRLDGPNSECWVLLDRNRLKQVWMNFLTNAVKCTKSGYIKMGYGIERKGLRIYVEDTGIGIPDDLHDKVFTRFEKLNEFSQGTGLGLTISRAIVEAAGGEVGFTSKLGVGSTFWAWLPLRP